MPNFDSALLASWSSGQWVGEAPSRITGFGNDTRVLSPGDVFVALRTTRRDGHDFLHDARTHGASCALVSRKVVDPLPQLVVDDALLGLQRVASAWRSNLKMPFVGVTGSVGKTSVKEMLRQALGARVHATRANLNNTLGVPLAILQTDPALHDAAVIEVGMSEPGELAISARVLRPDVAVVTNVRSAHLEGCGSIEGVAQEKAELIRALARDGEAFILAQTLQFKAFDDLRGRCVALCEEGETAPDGVRRTARYSLQSVNQGWHLQLRDPVLGELSVELGPISQGQAHNAALASLAALRSGAKSADITKALSAWRPLSGRGSVHDFSGQPLYIDCYNASPASLADAAQTFVRQTKGPRLFILGGMAELGAESIRLHQDAGRALPLSPGDHVIVYGGDAPALAAVCGGRVAMDHAELAAAIQAHRGPILLKGSRAHALERALPEPLRKTLGFH
jgi:UDP-N-acetylmuramoyl-tripeptide--D-alanyl-D-alanine ligase